MFPVDVLGVIVLDVTGYRSSGTLRDMRWSS